MRIFDLTSGMKTAMTKTSILIPARLDHLLLVILSLFASPLKGAAFAPNNARTLQQIRGKHIGAGHHGHGQTSLPSTLPTSSNCMSNYSASYRHPRSKTILSISKSSRRALRTKTSLSVMIASLCIAIKPASASAASGIISSVKDLLNSSGATPTSSYHLTRILFLRFLAIVYTAAFSVAKFQNKGLIGDRGISPARNILDAAEMRGEAKSTRRREWVEQRKSYTSSNNIFAKCKNKVLDSTPANIVRDKFWHRTDRMDRPLPTLLWFARDRDNLNPWLDGLANVGLLLSTIMFATGSANVLLILGLWLIQRSFMAVGGQFYGYGWEPQLAELTFHAAFLVPLLSMNPFFGSSIGSGMGAFPVPTLVIWAIRWYLFKIMMGAGLIKLKSSDQKWKMGDMSAMYSFYETQPVPNPLTKYFHNMPKAWHRFEVWSNHFVELVAPVLLLMPFRKWRLAGGLIQIMFQATLIFSGNLSFLNWLTIAPAIFCLDDSFLVNNLPPLAQKIVIGTPTTQSYIQSITDGIISASQAPLARTIISIVFFLFMAKLNLPVIQNLLARRQVMNGSFDKLRLCGTYGAFGVVAENRDELIIESANHIDGPWREYHFKVKPGHVNRRPPWISPYHHRLDWQMWIASQSGRVERSPWLMRLLLKLLRQENDVIDLIESDPWGHSNTTGEDSTDGSPKYIRIEKYRYKFYNHKKDNAIKNSNINGEEGMKSPYWVRERVGRFFPRQGVMTADMLEEIVN